MDKENGSRRSRSRSRERPPAGEEPRSEEARRAEAVSRALAELIRGESSQQQAFVAAIEREEALAGVPPSTAAWRWEQAQRRAARAHDYWERAFAQHEDGDPLPDPDYWSDY